MLDMASTTRYEFIDTLFRHNRTRTTIDISPQQNPNWRHGDYKIRSYCIAVSCVVFSNRFVGSFIRYVKKYVLLTCIISRRRWVQIVGSRYNVPLSQFRKYVVKFPIDLHCLSDFHLFVERTWSLANVSELQIQMTNYHLSVSKMKILNTRFINRYIHGLNQTGLYNIHIESEFP
jgi:hypothetical protein